MKYCKSKAEFWPMLSTTLHILKKETEAPTEYDCLGIEGLNYDDHSGLNEFIIEAYVKSVSYAFKIYSIQIFELCFE